jgi:hypothetical protein
MTGKQGRRRLGVDLVSGAASMTAKWGWRRKEAGDGDVAGVMRHGVDVNHRPLGNPKRRYDEHGSKFSLSKKPRFIESSRKKPNSRR